MEELLRFFFTESATKESRLRRVIAAILSQLDEGRGGTGFKRYHRDINPPVKSREFVYRASEMFVAPPRSRPIIRGAAGNGGRDAPRCIRNLLHRAACASSRG